MEEALSRQTAEVPQAPSVFERLYPEYGAGGFSRVDLWVPFYTRVNALLRPDMTVVVLRGWDKLDTRLKGTKKLLETLAAIAKRAKAA